MTSRKIPLYIKLLFSFLSLLFFLSLLEFGLWAYGRMVFEPEPEFRTDETSVSSTQHSVKVMAVGDSFTHGGLVEGHETYTAHMRQQLKAQNVDHVQVMNKGICELNSHELLKRYPRMLEKYNPDVVVLLVGATNRFNPWDYDLHKNRNPWTVFMSWLSDRRVTKMARFIKLNLAGHHKHLNDKQAQDLMFLNLRPTRNITTAHDQHMQYIEQMTAIDYAENADALGQAWLIFNNGYRAEAINVVIDAVNRQRMSALDGGFALAHFYFEGGEMAKAQDQIRQLKARFPDNPLVFQAEVYYAYRMARWYKDQLKYDDAIDQYMEAIVLEPNADYFYYEMNKLYELQSHFDSRAMHQKLKAKLKQVPALALSELFMDHIRMYEHKQEWDDGIEGWIRHDLDQIIRISQQKGVRLVLQNYPTDYTLANRVIEQLREQWNLPMVDHHAIFKTLDPIDDYVLDDDHCSSRGHAVMAQNIINVLKREQMIQP